MGTERLTIVQSGANDGHGTPLGHPQRVADAECSVVRAVVVGDGHHVDPGPVQQGLRAAAELRNQ